MCLCEISMHSHSLASLALDATPLEARAEAEHQLARVTPCRCCVNPRVHLSRYVGSTLFLDDDPAELALLHLLYYRPSNARCTALDAKLFDLAARHRGQLRLVVKHSDEGGYLFGGWVSGTSPTVLFVRNGETVAEMVGDLPAHEIDGLLRSALSCNAVR
ncbi:MAG: hypothetical protein JWR48_6996 [Mycobacterium sp.]|nr:hypothetical protein [Mycobacterium sp.]